MPDDTTTFSENFVPNNFVSTPMISIRPEPVAKIVAVRFLTVVKRRHRPAAKTPNEVSKLSSEPTCKIALDSEN